jgi:hypothetical protein
MERIHGEERQVFWPVTAEPEILNAQPPKLRVFHYLLASVITKIEHYFPCILETCNFSSGNSLG